MKEQEDRRTAQDHVLMQAKVYGFTSRQEDSRDLFSTHRGDVVNIYTDRQFVKKVLLPNGIPHKGRAQASLKEFWLSRLGAIAIPNDLKSSDLESMPGHFGKIVPTTGKPEFLGRALLCWSTENLRYQFHVKGYLVQADYKEYQSTGSINGILVPMGLSLGAPLPEPIVVFKRKTSQGSIVDASFKALTDELGGQLAVELKNRCILLYQKACDVAINRGLMIISTKFEFGRFDNRGAVMLVGQVLTPESTCYCALADYELGMSPVRFETKPLEPWLRGLRWNGISELPELPDHLAEAVSERYMSVATLLKRNYFIQEET